MWNLDCVVVRSEPVRKDETGQSTQHSIPYTWASKETLEPNYGASSLSTERCNYEESKEEFTDEIQKNKFQLFHRFGLFSKNSLKKVLLPKKKNIVRVNKKERRKLKHWKLWNGRS